MERRKLKTKKEVTGALASHTANMARLTRDPAMMRMMAHDLGWTEDYLKGYNEGVKFAYGWFLGDSHGQGK